MNYYGGDGGDGGYYGRTIRASKKNPEKRIEPDKNRLISLLMSRGISKQRANKIAQEEQLDNTRHNMREIAKLRIKPTKEITTAMLEGQKKYILWRQQYTADNAEALSNISGAERRAAISTAWKAYKKQSTAPASGGRRRLMRPRRLRRARGVCPLMRRMPMMY
jgi:hypothetical protein